MDLLCPCLREGRWDTAETSHGSPRVARSPKISTATDRPSRCEGMLVSSTPRPSAYPLYPDVGGRLPTFHHEPKAFRKGKDVRRRCARCSP